MEKPGLSQSHVHELLLPLSQAERDQANAYVQAKVEQAPGHDYLRLRQLADLSEDIAEVTRTSHVFRETRLGERMREEAAAGLEQLAESCRCRNDEIDKVRFKSRTVSPQQPTSGLATEVTREQEDEAGAFIQKRLEHLNLMQLNELRQATTGICAWWQSESGQRTTLMVNQYGDINTSTGRNQIRRLKREIQDEVIRPLRQFARQLADLYSKRNAAFLFAEQPGRDEDREVVEAQSSNAAATEEVMTTGAGDL